MSTAPTSGVLRSPTSWRPSTGSPAWPGPASCQAVTTADVTSALDGPAAAVPLEELAYTAQLGNNGPDAAAESTLTLDWSGATFQSVQAQMPCSLGAGTLIMFRGDAWQRRGPPGDAEPQGAVRVPASYTSPHGVPPRGRDAVPHQQRQRGRHDRERWSPGGTPTPTPTPTAAPTPTPTISTTTPTPSASAPGAHEGTHAASHAASGSSSRGRQPRTSRQSDHGLPRSTSAGARTRRSRAPPAGPSSRAWRPAPTGSVSPPPTPSERPSTASGSGSASRA